MAETTREMVVRLSMDAGGFKKTADEISRQIKNVDSEIKNLGSSGRGGKSKSLLEEKLELQLTAVNNLKSAVQQAQQALNGATTPADQLAKAKQLSTLETQLANAEEKAKGIKDKLSAVNLMQFSTLATNFGEAMRKMGRKMTLYVSAPLLALGGKAYKSALDFESATVSMQKTVDETDTTKYEDIKNAFLEISETSPVGFVELMELAGQAGALGVGADQIVEFVKAVAMISVTADDLDASTGADALARFLNVTEKGDYSHIENAASAVTALGNSTAATEGEIIEMAQRMAAAGELAGFATEDILALAAGFTSVGINAEAGGSSASKLMKYFQLTSEVFDIDSLQDVGKVFGLYTKSAEDMTEADWQGVQTAFSEMWNADQAGTVIAFFQGLSDMDASGAESVLAMLDEMGMTEIRLSNLVGSAASNPDLFTTALAIAREAYALNIALAEEAEKRYATAESYQETQFNRMENASADAGENIVDVVQPIIEKVGDLAKAFGELDEDTQDRWIAVAGALIAVGPVSTGIGLVATAVGKIVGYIGKIKAGDAKAFNLIMSALSGPAGGWLLAGAGIAAIIAGIESIEMPSEKIINNLKNIKIELDEDSYNATMSALAEVKAQSDALAGEKGEYNRNVSSAVKAGYGTADMYGTALGYEAAFAQNQIADISGKYADQIDELNGAIGAETDAARQAALAKQRDDLQAQWDAEVAAAKTAYMDQVNALVTGMLAGQPEAKAALEQAAQDYDLLVALMDLMDFTSSSTDAEAIAARKAAVFTPEVIARFFPGLTEIGPAQALIMQETLLNSLSSALRLISGEDSLAYTLLQSILGDPLASDLFDKTMTSGILDGLIELLDFKNAGETAGQEWYDALTPGLADPITDSIPGVEAAMDAMTDAGVKKAAAMGAAMSAAFAANLKLNVTGMTGTGTGTGIGTGTTGKTGDIRDIRRELNNARARTQRGYGA